jgi:hypothetical protein
MENTEQLGVPKRTTERERSAAYPGVSLEESFKFTLDVLKHFPTKDRIINRADIATVLETSESTVLRDVSACVQFGFFIKLKEGYQISKLFRDIKDPLNDNERRKLFVTAFKSPKLYQQLIEKFDGHAVPEELKVHLIRFFGIAEKAAPSAAEIFIESAKFCGVLSDKRVLDVNVIFDKITDNNIQVAEVIPQGENGSKNEDVINHIDITPKENEVRRLPAVNDLYEDVRVKVTNNKFIFLKYPQELNKKDIAILRKEIEKIEILVGDD